MTKPSLPIRSRVLQRSRTMPTFSSQRSSRKVCCLVLNEVQSVLSCLRVWHRLLFLRFENLADALPSLCVLPYVGKHSFSLICTLLNMHCKQIDESNVCVADSRGRIPSQDVQASSSSIFSERHGPYTQRELFFQQQESSGAFTFQYIENDGKAQSNVW